MGINAAWRGGFVVAGVGGWGVRGSNGIQKGKKRGPRADLIIFHIKGSLRPQLNLLGHYTVCAFVCVRVLGTNPF